MEHQEVNHGAFRMIACPHILSNDKGKIDVSRPVGGTITDIMRSIGWTHEGLSARVFLDGELVKNAAWEYTLPTAGQSLVVRAIPMGGENGKSALRIVAMIAVIAAALAMPGAIMGMGFYGAIAMTTPGMAGALSAVISIAGTLAVTARIPPPLPRLCDLRQVQHG